MRELKYRVWSVDDMTYDDPYSHSYYAMTQDGKLDFYCHGDHWDSCAPDKYIIEQYTGLKDKNGKEIYEGDIVKANYFESHYAALDVGKTKQITGRIQFGSGCFYISSMSDETPLFQSGGSNNVEAIGNIHENPELLGGGE